MIEKSAIPKQYLYRQAGFFITIFGIFGIFIRILTAFPFQIWEIFIYVGLSLFILSVITIIPLYKCDAANKRAMGKDFLEGPIAVNIKKKEDFFLGVESYTRIYIDFDDDTSLEELFKKNLYVMYAKSINREEGVKQFLAREESGALDEQYIKKISDEYSKLEARMSKKRSAEQELTVAEKKELDEKQKEFNKAMETLKPFKDFKLEWVNELDRKLLKKLQFYYLELYSEEKFEDSENGFDKLLIVTTDDLSKVLRTEPGEGEYQGWTVDLRTCRTFWILWGYITDKMPCLYLRFSENMIEQEIDAVTQMRAIALTYMQLKVVEKWIYHLSTIPDKLVKEITKYQERADTFEEAYSLLLQQNAMDNLIYSSFIRDKTVEDLRLENLKGKKHVQIAMLINIMIFVSFGLVLLFLI